MVFCQREYLGKYEFWRPLSSKTTSLGASLRNEDADYVVNLLSRLLLYKLQGRQMEMSEIL